MKKTTKAVQHTCFKCAKIIKGQMVYVVTPLFMVAMGDFEKAFHPKCYDEAEAEAAKELGKEV